MLVLERLNNLETKLCSKHCFLYALYGILPAADMYLWQDDLVHPLDLQPASPKGEREMQGQDGSSDSPAESQRAALVIVLGCSPSQRWEFPVPFFSYSISPGRN